MVREMVSRARAILHRQEWEDEVVVEVVEVVEGDEDEDEGGDDEEEDVAMI